jgi:glutamate N-acetyltransferase/amino-acid N-acetyltransferase
VLEKSLTISFVGVVEHKQISLTIYDKGNIHFDTDIENQASQIFATSNFKIVCDIAVGQGKYTAYGCDIGYDYIKINSQYRS